MNGNNALEEIQQLYSEWARLDKATRLGWLAGVRTSLAGLANQFAQYVHARRCCSLNDDERECARQLLEMIQYADAEGTRTIIFGKSIWIIEDIPYLCRKEANPESAESSWTLSVGELLFFVLVGG